MHGKQWVAGVGAVLVLAATALSAVDEDALRPGLVTTYTDPAGVEIVRLEPTVALAVKAGEAPHPRLKAEGFKIQWQGYVNTLRAGEYRFRAVLRGQVSVRIDGKEVLSVEHRGADASPHEGPRVRLEAGVHEFVAVFQQASPGAAQMELSWQAPHFRREPLPYDVLFHLPDKAPARLAADERIEQGRLLAEERSCLACHQADAADRLGKGLVQRKGPDLSQVGQRVQPGWIYHWLDDPHQVRPRATMPQLFGEDDVGRTQRFAVTRYLASLGGPLKPAGTPPNDKQMLTSIAQGKRLFSSIGCLVCHRNDKGGHDLPDLPAKISPDRLAEYLANPLKFDPSGRMPHMLLQQPEALDLARYLCQAADQNPEFELPDPPGAAQLQPAFKAVDPRPDEWTAFQRLPADVQWLDLGKRVVIDKGCNNCHTIAPGGKPFANVLASAAFTDIQDRKTLTAGCLADAADRRGPTPWFGFKEQERQALWAFLSEGAKGAGSPAPAYAAKVALVRFNCVACHGRDGQGGLSPELVEELRRYEKTENAEAVTPPPLTGVGHKLRTGWVRQVLTQAVRARPWMGLRMPQFGPANVGSLPEGLAALEGIAPDDAVYQTPLTPAKVAAGRQLVGKSAFGCISCHDIAGNVSGGTRGPDLATMNQRVRFDWYERWLEQAQRMQPGTRMPTVFPDGKSQLAAVLNGDAAAQADAMWAYLSLGPTLPLPEGLEPPKGLTLTVLDRPVVLRTFMPDAGAKALAVGYPGGVSVAFDAATGRLAYGWTGNFLDASPVWNNRGGAPAKLLGPRFWTAPPGCSWGVSDSKVPPDFAARAKDPAYGAAPPEGQIYDGPRRYQFLSYTTDPAGWPSFQYRVDALEIEERPEPLKSAVATGLARQFHLQTPAGQNAWLLAGETAREPRWLDAQGQPLPLDLKTPVLELPAGGRLLVLPQDGERVLALAVATVAPGARWHLRRQGSTWQALLVLPPTSAPARTDVTLKLWVPYRDQPEFLKELIGGR